MAEQSKRRSGSEREAYWRGVVDGFGGSGLSVREYCVSVQVSQPSFYWWRREFARRTAKPKAAAGGPPVFVPIAIAKAAAESAKPADLRLPEPDGAAGVEVRLRGGHVVRLSGPVDRRLLAELFAALEAAPC
jgi:hypothetical protein